MFDFGLRIRQLRERNKMSQEELGRRVGRSKSVISSYENNIKIPLCFRRYFNISAFIADYSQYLYFFMEYLLKK